MTRSLSSWIGGTTLALSAGALVAPVARADDRAICDRLIRDLAHSRDLTGIARCQEFYFQNPDADVPAGSFNRLVALGYRYLAIDPHAVTQYGDLSWVLWSKWTSWRQDPALMPDGKDRLREATDLLLKGRRLNPSNPAYHFEAAGRFFTMAYSYSPELTPLAIESYELTDHYLPQTTPVKIRARLQIGHIYRWLGNKPAAIAAYQRVLEIDPNNKVAESAIAKLVGP